MREIFGNLWDALCDLRVVTTNGDVNRHKRAVMGRGCAKEAAERFPGLAYHFAKLLEKHGNRVMRLAETHPDGSTTLGLFSKDRSGTVTCSFPVKHHWKDEADPELIARSARQLVALADAFGYGRVVLARPGCGNGRLSWEDVRPALAEVLDDRFSVITFAPNRPRRR